MVGEVAVKVILPSTVLAWDEPSTYAPTATNSSPNPSKHGLLIIVTNTSMAMNRVAATDYVYFPEKKPTSDHIKRCFQTHLQAQTFIHCLYGI